MNSFGLFLSLIRFNSVGALTKIRMMSATKKPGATRQYYSWAGRRRTTDGGYRSRKYAIPQTAKGDFFEKQACVVCDGYTLFIEKQFLIEIAYLPSNTN